MPPAPIALFLYNRPHHASRTIKALSQNNLASRSDLFVFCDAAKSDVHLEAVSEVRALAKKIEGFRSVTIIEREFNLGLADSIMSGVTQLIETHGTVIVVEDDLETSPFFLEYMNDALQIYKDNDRVMSVSGFRYPVQKFADQETFFLHIPLCWGWATWSRAWKEMRRDTAILESIGKEDIRKINFDNTYNFWNQAVRNKEGKLKTWFIFWYMSVYLKDGLTLFPSISLVRNLGMDGSGQNSDATSRYDVILSDRKIRVESTQVELSRAAYAAHKTYFSSIKGSVFKRGLSRLYSRVRRIRGMITAHSDKGGK